MKKVLFWGIAWLVSLVILFWAGWFARSVYESPVTMGNGCPQAFRLLEECQRANEACVGIADELVVLAERYKRFWLVAAKKH